MLSDKVMVIDDDPRVIKSIKLALKNYEIIEFTSGKNALKYLKTPNNISLILLDVMMPVQDGLSVLHDIREFNKKVIIIMMTAYGSMDIVVQALRSRADDFVEKPFDINKLRDKINSALREKEVLSPEVGSANKVERIKNFIQRNHSNVSLESIANEMRLSCKYVSRMFNEKNKTNYRDYKVSVKVDIAKTLLLDSSFTISEISYKLGYLNPESFMRIFKSRTDLTPTMYREKNLSK